MFFNKHCSWKVESKGPYPIYKGDGFVVKYITLSTGLSSNNVKPVNPKNAMNDTDLQTKDHVMCRQSIMSDEFEPHYILSIGIHGNYDPEKAIQTIQLLDADEKFKDTTKATYISPPSLSFAHGKQYKSLQNNKRLDEMNGMIKDWSKTTKPEMRFIDYSKLSKNLVSMDGVHYGPNLNKVLLSIYASRL